MEPPRPFLPDRRILAAGLGALGLAAGLLLSRRGDLNLSAYYYLTQDVWLLMAGAGAMVAAAWLAPQIARSAQSLSAKGLAAHPATPWAIAGVAALVAFAGTKIVFGSTPVSYDEVQANFDAAVFLGGHLAAPVPEAWRTLIPALAPVFFLEIPGDVAWISSYWPVHAMVRALAQATIGRDASSPMLAFIAILATWRVARRLWPDAPQTAFVATILLATSPQVLVTAMTPYAMTAHLALNMLWLALFLENRRLAHAGAILVGALALGLHQVVFHALFVAPFLLLLVAQRRWALAAVYGGAYAVMGLGWIAYPEIVKWLYDPGADLQNPLVTVLLRRLQGAVDAGASGPSDILSLGLFNIARLVGWSNPVAILLFALAVPGLRTARGVEIALAGGVVLTFATAMLILPYQGHGWGYRYLHGELGCLSLVAAAEWTRRAATSSRWRGIWASGSATTMVVLLPLAALFAARWTAPIRAAETLIRNAPAEIVLVDTDAFPFAQDLIRNAPDLSNRPLVMALKRLDAPTLAALCEARSIALLDGATGARLDLMGAANGASNPAMRLPERCRVVRL